MIDVEVRFTVPGDVWTMSKKYQLSAIPPVGAVLTTTNAGNCVEVDGIDVHLDTNTFVVLGTEDPDILRSFYAEGGWEVTGGCREAAKRDLAGLL